MTGENSFQLQNYNYTLPEELIAQEPLKERDSARLLVLNRRTGETEHSDFRSLGAFFKRPVTFVLNNTRVIPARLFGNKATGARVEIFLLNKAENEPAGSFVVLMRPMKRLRDGEKIFFEGTDLTATVVSKERRIVRFNQTDVVAYLEEKGHIPLPPYIKREDTREDRINYQTVYARESGSVAAPTAGLHFTEELIESLKEQGHSFEEVTLHINYGTFKPVEVGDIRKHPMHEEEYTVDPAVWKRIQASKQEGRPVVAVGTTACRTLEAVAGTGELTAKTNLFIFPGFEFKMVDSLLTNFHLPESTLLMLVSALGGMDAVKRAYTEAVQERYRFFSYGDAMLVL